MDLELAVCREENVHTTQVIQKYFEFILFYGLAWQKSVIVARCLNFIKVTFQHSIICILTDSLFLLIFKTTFV